MLRAVIFLGLTMTVASHDESHLMQQGVGVTSRVTAEIIKSAASAVLDELQGVRIKDVERRMAVTLLMKQVAAAEKLEPEEVEVINQVINLLQGLIEDLKLEKTNAQTSINEVNNVIAGCNHEDHHTSDNTHHTSMTTKQGDHKDCRDEQKVLHDQEEANCQALFNLLNNIDGEHCVKKATSDPILTHVTSWDSFFTSGASFFETKYEEFKDAADLCTGKTTALNEKITECEGLQQSFENAFCAWRMARILRDQALTNCYNQAVNEHNGFIAGWTSSSNERTELGAALEHMICVLEKLIAGELDNAITACDFTAGQLSQHQTDFNVTFPAIDPKDDVDMSVVNDASKRPGNVGFIMAYYADIHVDTPVANTGVSCAAV